MLTVPCNFENTYSRLWYILEPNQEEITHVSKSSTEIILQNL